MFIFDRIRHSAYKEQVVDSAYLMALQGVNYILPLIIVPYLMVTLGAEKYGHIGFATGYSYYFCNIIDFGFNLSATKQIAICFQSKNFNELNKTFFSVLYAKLILFALSSVVFFILLFIVAPFRQYSMTVLCMYPLIIGNTFTFTWLFQGIGKIKVISTINSITKILVLPLTFIFVRSENDYNMATLIQSLVFVAAALLSGIYLRKEKIIHYTEVGLADIKRSFSDSWPLFLSSAASTIYTSLYTVILAIFASPVSVGLYSAAERIVRALCSVLHSTVSQAFYPKVAALSVVNKEGANKLFYKLRNLLLSIMFFVFLFIFISADMIEHLLGGDYNGIALLLRIMSLIPIFVSQGGLYGQMGLIAMGDESSKRNFMKAYWIAVPLSLSLVFVLSLFEKELGAAIALLLTESLVCGLLIRYYYIEKRDFSFRSMNK